MIKQIKSIFEIFTYLFKRAIAGSIKFRKDGINFNREKQLITNSLIRQGFSQVSHLIKPPRAGIRLTKKVDKSVFWSSLIQNLAYIKSCIFRAPNNILCCKSFKLNYFRIPKAASTSMLQILIARELSIDTTTLSQKQIDVLGDLLFQNDVEEEVINFQNLAIVRNPLSRIYSVYKSIFKGHSQDFIYESYLFGLFNKDMTFASFVDKLVQIPSTIADYHFKPQYELIYHHQHVKEAKIFKMEEIDTVLNPYLKTNFDISLAHLHKGQEHGESFRDIYSLETARKIYKYYYQDFTFLNYSSEFEALIDELSKNPVN